MSWQQCSRGPASSAVSTPCLVVGLLAGDVLCKGRTGVGVCLCLCARVASAAIQQMHKKRMIRIDCQVSVSFLSSNLPSFTHGFCITGDCRDGSGLIY